MKRVRVTPEIFKSRAKEKHHDAYDYSKVKFTKVHDMVEIICPLHGSFNQKAYSHLAGIGCPKCGDALSASKRRANLADTISKALDVHGDKYSYASATEDRFVITCSEHGDFEQSRKVHLRGGGCPKCNAGGRIGRNEWINRAKLVHGDKYDYTSSVYTRIDRKINITCPQHGEFEQLADLHVRQGSGCPKCSNSGISKPETELYNYVKSLAPDAEQSCRTFIAPQEVDIIAPSKKLAIEFNGLYWHSEQHKDKKYHITKRKVVEAAGYRLISVREDLWRDRNEQVKSIIRNALGLNIETVYARKCNIVEVSRDVAKQFMLENHVQGFRGATYHYALEHAGATVAVMSVTHWKGKDEWELVRYATTGNVVGGLSKLWKHVTRTHNVKKAYSYVDRDLFTGSSYGNAGFTLTSSSVGFRIVNGSNTESREKWNNAPEGLTQSQWYEREGVRRIYDSGQDRLTWLK